MTDPLDHSTRYDLMTSDQVPADEIAEWLKEPGFAAYVEGRNASMAARQAGVNAPAPSADAVIAAGSAMANILYNLKQTTIGDERLRASMKKCQEDWDKARSLATIPAAEPVVETLKWCEGKSRYPAYAACNLSLRVSYTIRTDEPANLGRFALFRDLGSENEWLAGFEALEAAKAAAQSDYEQRIRSALVASPQPARETELAAERDRLAQELNRIRSDREYVIGWNDGYEHAGGAPANLQFPTMLRKMWSGQEVQSWIDDALAALRARSQP